MSKNKSEKKNHTKTPKKSSSKSSSPKSHIINTDPFFPKEHGTAISLFDSAGELPNDVRRKKTPRERLQENKERLTRYLTQQKINEIKMEEALEGLSPLSGMAERFRLENEKLKKKEELKKMRQFPNIPDPKKPKTTIQFPSFLDPTSSKKKGGKKANTKHRRQQKIKKSKKTTRTRRKKTRRTRRKTTKMKKM
jgi:hypothetical protein